MRPIPGIPLAAVFAAALTLTAPAFAGTTDNFTITDGSSVSTFSLPTSPAPDDTFKGGFDLNNVAYSLNGVAQTPNTIDFFTPTLNGGLDIFDIVGNEPVISTTGAQLFTGGIDNPTFLTGTFQQFDFYNQDDPISVEISQGEMAATPEPSSMVLFGTGVLGIAGLVRRRIAGSKSI